MVQKWHKLPIVCVWVPHC